MILLWGVPNDGPIRAVREALEAGGESPLMLDQFDVANSDISFNPARPYQGTLSVGGQRIELEQIRSVYLRPYETGRVLRAAGADEPAANEHAFRFDDAMLLWIELTPALVVNRPSAMTSNSSKPLQSALIRQAGFRVPDTLLTSDRDAAADFLARHRRVVYKSTGGTRSKVSLLNETVIERLRNAACPLQIQEHIEGTDFRVHVVGDRVFACSIASGAVDYRYPSVPDQSPVIESVDLPPDIEARCILLAHELGLAVTGIDLRRSADGSWVCFEANPSPGYTYYEEATGAPITASLVSLLRNPSQNAQHRAPVEQADVAAEIHIDPRRKPALVGHQVEPPRIRRSAKRE